LNTSSYLSQDIPKMQSSYDGKEYICKTCHSKAIQGRLPCQAIMDNLNVDDVPSELGNLKKLGTNINCTAQHIIHCIWKSKSYAKRKTKKNYGCCMLCTSELWSLPRPPERPGIILLKLKRKLKFRGHAILRLLWQLMTKPWIFHTKRLIKAALV